MTLGTIDPLSKVPEVGFDKGPLYGVSPVLHRRLEVQRLRPRSLLKVGWILVREFKLPQ